MISLYYVDYIKFPPGIVIFPSGIHRSRESQLIGQQSRTPSPQSKSLPTIITCRCETEVLAVYGHL